MAAPILTIGDLEPARPTIAINRTAPDGAWQRWKYNHLDVLLRWMPVRFAQRHDVYALRLPGEFGLRDLQRIRNMQDELREAQAEGAPSEAHMARLLRAICAMVLDAPPDVIDALGPVNHLAVVTVFQRAVPAMRAQVPPVLETPPTLDASSPASPASTAAVGRTG
jgi:hypothetical protein